jgi:HK97 family phage portal protein
VGFLESVRAAREEQRVIGGVPWQPWLNPFARFDTGGPVSPSRQQYGVEAALGLPALYAGAKILADSTASLPVKVYRKQRDGRLIPDQGPHLFEKPSVLGTSFDWLFTCISSLVLQGNAWGLITGRNAYGFPTGIEWIPADMVYCEEDQQQPFNPMRTKVFAYGREMRWYGNDAELFHVKGFSVAGKLEGISPLRAFALTITAGEYAQQYGVDWYKSGGFPPGTFQNSEIEVDPDQAAQIRQMLVSSLRKREPLVFGRDWDYTPVTVPPSEAQFIDAMQLTATQIAAILNLPANRLGGKTGDSLTYSTVEAGQLQVIEALHPWIRRLEAAFSDLLPSNKVIRFNTDALLRTDLKTRTDIYQIQRNIGLRTTDELRELEDLPPLPGDAGNEVLPLLMMVSMAQRSGALPKSMIPQVEFLMDLAGDRLEKLQKEGLTASPPGGEFAPDPKTGVPAGPASDPGKFYANMLNSYSRSLEAEGHYEQAAPIRYVLEQYEAQQNPEKANGGWVLGGPVRKMIEDIQSGNSD